MSYCIKKLPIIVSIFIVSIVLIVPIIALADVETTSYSGIRSFLGFDTSSPQGYINSVYRYGISLIAILATAGIVYGGFRYMTSSGNEEAATSGKGAIMASLTGLVLALFSHMILQQLDPRLVELRLTVPEVEQPGSCESNSDCSGGNVCIRRACEPPRTGYSNPDSSSHCESDDDCSGASQCLNAGQPDSMCSDPQVGQANHCCREDNTCDSGLNCLQGTRHDRGVTCDNGVCTNGEAGSACLSNDNCGEGFQCQERDNTCIASDSGRDFNDECDRNEQCSTGFCAQTIGICTSGDNTSTHGQGAPECRADDDCRSDFYCPIERPQKFCTRKKDFDAPCTRDVECMSSYCDRDTDLCN